MVNTTTLQELINRMDSYMPIRNMDTVLKVNAIDSALRMFRMYNNPPWTQKKTTLKVFANQFLYPTASDQAQVGMLDDPMYKDQGFGQHPRYIFSSLRDFLEAPEPRNYLGEIWQYGQKLLGVRNQTSPGLFTQECDSAQVVADWAGSGDAGTPVLDNVVFLTGPDSIRFPVTFSSGTAVMTNTFQNAVSNPNWQRTYFFVNVFLSTATAPASVSIRLKQDNSNYLDSGAITTQFAGQAFVPNDWNTIAFNLNTATQTGTITGTSFTSAVYTWAETVSGNYYFDVSSLRGWILQDYWYYSQNNVQLPDATQQMYFSLDSANYDLATVLLGDTAWHDCIVYEADLYLLSDQKEAQIYAQVLDLRTRAWEKFYRMYPDNTPEISTNIYRFQTDYQNAMFGTDQTNFG